MKSRNLVVIGSIFILGGAWLSSCGKTPDSPSSPSPTATPTATGVATVGINAGVVTTLAGQLSAGSTNATGTAASFHLPKGVAVDASGNVYVADTNNSLIRKISVGGVVTTFAGGGAGTATNGTGTAASFNNPQGIAVDASGNVYVADTGNQLIREINTSAVVITLAGMAGTSGNVNATGTSASFDNPTGVAVDASGNVYVADQNNQLIRKITSGGVVTTLAGTAGATGSVNATGTSASFNNPTGLAVDTSGNVYVADQNNQEIRKISAGGVVTTLAGTVGVTGSVNATGTAASFNYPYDVTVDAMGNVYVADGNNSLIRKITQAGVVTTLAGTAGSTGSTNGTGIFASFDVPYGIAVDSSDHLYVADTSNNMIREIQ